MSDPKQLKIDLSILIGAMEGLGGDEARDFLDLRTGQIHMVDDELLRAVEDDDVDDLPDWQHDSVPVAKAVLEGDENLVEVPRIDSGEAMEITRDFVAGVRDARAREMLAEALSQPKPFRRFKDALLSHPAVREQWFTFDNA